MNFSIFGLVVFGYVISGLIASSKKKKSRKVKPGNSGQWINQENRKKQETNHQTPAEKAELIEEILDHMEEKSFHSKTAGKETGNQAVTRDDQKIKTLSEDSNQKAESTEFFDFTLEDRPSDQEGSEIIDLDLGSREEVARAMILSEILSPPLSMR